MVNIFKAKETLIISFAVFVTALFIFTIITDGTNKINQRKEQSFFLEERLKTHEQVLQNNMFQLNKLKIDLDYKTDNIGSWERKFDNRLLDLETKFNDIQILKPEPMQIYEPTATCIVKEEGEKLNLFCLKG